MMMGVYNKLSQMEYCLTKSLVVDGGEKCFRFCMWKKG